MAKGAGKSGNDDPKNDQTDAILTAAEEELTVLGLRRSNVDEMARKAGVSRSTLYRRFQDKEALIAAVVNRVGNEAVTELRDAVAGKTGTEAAVDAFCAAVNVFNTRKILRVLFMGSERALPNELVRFLERKLIDLVVSQLAVLLKESGINKSDEELLVISELLMKISLSYLGNPSRFVSFDDPAAVREFAQKHLVPLVQD